ncbi:MAG: AAA family ATPase [Euryarchaeota archaeon]|nr:AAA family ATPase [Euryarchaeota archaeon]
MESLKLFESMKNPSFFGSDVTSVNILQTHISFVALTGKYAYKVKKPVNFGFLDFSTLEKRKYFCDEELWLNRRLCPDIYLDVLPVTQENNTLTLNGKGTIVDYVLKMKQFPQENIFTNLLKQNKINESVIEQICGILVDFYNSEPTSKEVDSYGKIESVKQNIDENFEQTKPVIDVTIAKETFERIKNASSLFFKRKKKIFDTRIKEGHIHDCHGDLHSGNIVVSDKIFIFDCIEFNKRFRFCDTASDIAFFAMDLDYLNHPYLSSHLIKTYVEKSKDIGIYDVLNFYKSYRAYVRGKVNGFMLNDSHIDQKNRINAIETAKKYFDLAEYYSSLFSLDLNDTKKPILFLVGGLTGTGKSTFAQKLAVDYHAAVINTDVVRKELHGIKTDEHHFDPMNKGLYAPEKVDHTYDCVMERADDLLKQKTNVVVDATLQKKKYRELAQEIAKKHHAIIVPIQCVCADDVVKKRLEERLKKKSVSDGRWEIYLNQKKTFEPFTAEEHAVMVDMGQDSYEYRMDVFRKILERCKNEKSIESW